MCWRYLPSLTARAILIGLPNTIPVDRILTQAIANISTLKVFVSYARGDASAFVEDLVAGLRLIGFDPFLDRHDIAAGEDWEARLSGLIHSADTVVFVVSPAAIASKRCAWEVENAIAMSKRIIPVVALAVADADVPPALKRLNYIFFNEPFTFIRSLGQLGDALRSDVDWIREHTRLAELAGRWLKRDRVEALLLRGAELEAAKSWMAGWKPGSPEVTDPHRYFIGASADAEAARSNRERQQLQEMAAAQAAHATALADREVALKTLSRRTTSGLLGAGALTAISGGLAWWGNDAERRFQDAQKLALAEKENSIKTAIMRDVARTDIEGQLAAYAASPGQLAADGLPGENSPYTKAVLKELANEDVPLQAALSRAHFRVMQYAKSDLNLDQRPFLSSDLNGDIYLRKRTSGRQLKAIVVTVDTLDAAAPPLANVRRDGEAWMTFLNQNGFDVQVLHNPKFEEWKAAIARVSFNAPAKQGHLGSSLIQKAGLRSVEARDSDRNTMIVFFFAGGGLYVNGGNYLFAADSHVWVNQKLDSDPKPGEVALRSFVSVEKLQAWARHVAAASIIVLDTNFNDVSTFKTIIRSGEETKTIWDGSFTR